MPELAAPGGRPLRVGIVTDGLRETLRADGSPGIANGGVGVYIYQLIRHLQELDDDSELVLLRCGAGRLDIYEGRPRTTAVFAPLNGRNQLGRWLDWPYRRLVREHALDLVHHPNQFGGVFLQRRVRQVVTLHDLSPLLFPELHRRRTVLRYRLLLRRSLERAARVIADSEHTRRDVLERGLVPEAKLAVVPLAVAPIYRPVRSAAFEARYELPERYVLTVGVLEPRKNHARLVEALRRLRESGQDVGLVIVGRSGWKWSDPRAAPGGAELMSWLRVYRDVPDADLAELYTRATVFAYPSLYEGFGLPVLEAMACGAPVVTSRAGSPPGVPSRAALFADPTDVDDLARKLGRVLADQWLRSRLRAEGPLHAREYTWRRTAEATRDVYRSAAGREG